MVCKTTGPSHQKHLKNEIKVFLLVIYYNNFMIIWYILLGMVEEQLYVAVTPFTGSVD